VYRQLPSVPLCSAGKGAGTVPQKATLEATLAALPHGDRPQCPAPPKSPNWRMPPLKDVKCPRPVGPVRYCPPRHRQFEPSHLNPRLLSYMASYDPVSMMFMGPRHPLRWPTLVS